jgi:hypothetical protein
VTIIFFKGKGFCKENALPSVHTAIPNRLAKFSSFESLHAG